jgi:hypothetical protein
MILKNNFILLNAYFFQELSGCWLLEAPVKFSGGELLS